ncbi:MAG: response regulator [Acidobacteriota bacterium]
MKPSLVFVDDEPNALNGLKRMLHSMHDEWDMTFCLTARQALKAMDEKHRDILVTDLLMPEMDGVQLLELVHARHPGVIRIVLSGHSDKKLGLKAARFAHQFLPKPYQAEELKRVILRILSLREVLINPDAQTIVARMDTLPTLPRVHQEIMRELQKPEPSINLVSELITQDMGLSASIMKMVNSAFFGLKTKVSSLHHAINLLGLDIISALALSAHMFSSFDPSKIPGFDLDKLWGHSLSTGLLAKAVGRAEGLSTQEQDDLYIAGILHDVGKLAMLHHGQAFYAEVVARCREENSSIWHMERRILKSSHAELGAFMLSLWGLDEKIVLGVFQHHEPCRSGGDCSLIPAALHAANSFEHELNVIHPGYSVHPLDEEGLGRLGLADRIPAWRDACEKALKEVREHGVEDTHR